MRSKRGLSPLIATVLLVVFALIIGTVTMLVGGHIPDEKPVDSSLICIPREQYKENPLKDIQMQYILNDIGLDEYLQQEPNALEELKKEG